MVMSAEFKEIEVEGAVYRYITFRHGDYDKGVTQHIEVYKGEDSIGGKDDPATYGEPHRNHHPASTMKGIAKILAGEIVRDWLAVPRT
jgi:hypothetical protein